VLRVMGDSVRLANMTLALKTIAFLIIVPGTVAVALPVAVVTLSPTDMALPLGYWRYAGVILMVLAGVIYVRCSVDLARLGRGLPSPTDPTQFLVCNGLYRRVRNPMYVAGSAFLFGEAIAFEAGVLLLYAAAVTACYHPAVVLLEEPALRARFGESYERYCAQVPRWLPRFGALKAGEISEP